MVSGRDRSAQAGPVIGDDEGRRALLVDGVVQSIAVESGEAATGYWAALLPSVRPRRALILGLGGGTVAHLLSRRFGTLEGVGLEVDPRVLALARAELGLALLEPGLQVLEGDAFDYLARCRERFDYVCVDLFRGGCPDGRVTGRPFLGRLRAATRPGAEVAFNLFKDRRLPSRIQRIERVLAVHSVEAVGKNVIVKATAR